MIDRLRFVARRHLIRGATCTAFVSLLGTFTASIAGGQSTADGQSTATGPSILDAYSPVTDAMLVDPPDGEWLMWRRTYGHWGYSPLDQINRSNVDELRLAWAWTMERGKQETTPLVHDGVMFLPQACDFVEAVDARDGTLLWTYRRERVEHIASLACANRNAVLFGDRIFLATHDAYLVALDARTGEVEWEQPVGDWTIGHHYSGGPQIIEGQVVAGMSGCYFINTRCWISAHDPETGEELWRTYTLAHSGEPGGDSWGDVPDEERRGGSAWIAPSYDPELGLIFTGVAVPVPWGTVQRGTVGDALYTNSTLALDARTGEIVWYFQHLPGDEFDQDHPFERIIVETEVAPDASAVEWISPTITPGERRKVVTGIPGKPGIIWTLDAATGDFLWARTTHFQNVIVGVDAEGRRGILNPELKHPQIGQEVIVCPHLGGGTNWQAAAYHPVTNALYSSGNNTCMEYTLDPVEPTVGMYHNSASYRRIHVPGSDENVGVFTAVHVATGRTLWQHRQRAGIGGSVLTTGGGLVFVTDDARRFRAFDAATGEVLWEQILNSTAGGYPVSYSVDGVQYIAIAAGGGPNTLSLTPEIQQRSGGNTLFVFRLH
ncbi:MAG: PQQ-binding-like beta-propeller repeat protein [Gemmatimonadetes bacterium]|nr:PQQ-binding-like beta-propeller repeat protein [Gemmatimonadota bacterium]